MAVCRTPAYDCPGPTTAWQRCWASERRSEASAIVALGRLVKRATRPTEETMTTTTTRPPGRATAERARRHRGSGTAGGLAAPANAGSELANAAPTSVSYSPTWDARGCGGVQKAVASDGIRGLWTSPGAELGRRRTPAGCQARLRGRPISRRPGEPMPGLAYHRSRRAGCGLLVPVESLEWARHLGRRVSQELTGAFREDEPWPRLVSIGHAWA
jgi:hypothetical protein